MPWACAEGRAWAIPVLHMKQTHWILLAAVLALAAKLYCAATTVGTNDAVFFYGFGKVINKYGLEYLYEKVNIFNHTPMIGGYTALLQSANPVQKFSAMPYWFFLRLPGIVADFLSVLILLRIQKRTGTPPAWAIALFALSPVSFMVSGYHGNVDSVMAMFLLAAAWMGLEKRPLLSGLALGLACNVKVAALLLTPVFFFWWRERAGWQRFFYTACVVILAGWSPALMYAPQAFLSNVLGYQGYWGIWGISYELRATGLEAFAQTGFEKLTSAQQVIMAATKYLIIGSTLLAAWWRRKADGLGLFHTLAWVWAVFFVFATGVAPQYFVWMAPFLLLALPRWSAVVTAAAAMFLFVFYNVTANVRVDSAGHLSGDAWALPWAHPWMMSVSKDPHILLWGPWQALPWVAMIGALVWMTRAFWKRSATGIPEKDIATL